MVTDWTVADVTPADPSVPASLALQDGPIAPADATVANAAVGEAIFATLTADALGPVDGLHAAVDAAHDTLADAGDATPFETDTGAALDDATTQAGAHGVALDALDPAALVNATAAHSTQAGGAIGDYDEPPPSDVPQIDAGPAPGSSGGDRPQI